MRLMRLEENSIRSAHRLPSANKDPLLAFTPATLVEVSNKLDTNFAWERKLPAA